MRFTEWFAEKRKNPNILIRYSLKGWKKLLAKTTYTSVNLRVFVSKSELFCSRPLLAQNWIFKYSARIQNTLRESKGRVAIGNADLIYNSSQRSKAFEFGTTTVQLPMSGGFICKTNYRARTIYFSIFTGRAYRKMLTIKLIYKKLIN